MRLKTNKLWCCVVHSCMVYYPQKKQLYGIRNRSKYEEQRLPPEFLELKERERNPAMRKEKKMNRVDLKGRTFRIKGQLIPHTDFMIAPKTSEKEKNLFMVQLFGIVIHGVKSTNEGTQMK